jgi:hypothetical protein
MGRNDEVFLNDKLRNSALKKTEKHSPILADSFEKD